MTNYLYAFLEWRFSIKRHNNMFLKLNILQKIDIQGRPLAYKAGVFISHDT